MGENQNKKDKVPSDDVFDEIIENKISDQTLSDKVSEEHILFGQQMASQHEMRAFVIFEKSTENSDKKESKLVRNTTFRLFDELQNYKHNKYDEDINDESGGNTLDKKLNWNIGFEFMK